MSRIMEAIRAKGVLESAGFDVESSGADRAWFVKHSSESEWTGPEMSDDDLIEGARFVEENGPPERKKTASSPVRESGAARG